MSEIDRGLEHRIRKRLLWRCLRTCLQFSPVAHACQFLRFDLLAVARHHVKKSLATLSKTAQRFHGVRTPAVPPVRRYAKRKQALDRRLRAREGKQRT